MAALRKASAYSKKMVCPYTRKSKVKKLSYIKTIPPQGVVKFNMGNEEFFRRNKYPYHLSVVSDEKRVVQIRSNALESCRQYIIKKLEKNLPGQFFFRITSYPHHIQRENKMLTGAGADRMQSGMQLSFGKPIARAAISKPGNEIFFVALQSKKAESFARKVISAIKSKLPCKIKIISEEIKKK